MILEKRYLQFKDVGKVFKLIAEELHANVNTQILICNKILNELKANNSDYNVYNLDVYFDNYIEDNNVSEWYVLHAEHAFSTEISKLGIRFFGPNYSQVSKFYFYGYNFSAKPCHPEEFNCFEHEIQRILVIEVS